MKSLALILGLAYAQGLQCQCDGPSKPVDAIQKQILKQYKLLTPKQIKQAPRPDELGQKLLKTWQQYHIRPELVLALIAHESKFQVHAVNKRTKDFGLMQINERTAWHMGLHKTCLMQWQCNYDAGITVLAYMQKRYGSTEALWYARYNVGTRTRARHTTAYKTYAVNVAQNIIN